MELQSDALSPTEMMIDGHKTFWTMIESVIIGDHHFPALLCRWDTERNIPVEYITKFSLEKVIGKGRVKNKLKKWKKNKEYIPFDQPKGTNPQIKQLIGDSMKSINCPNSGTLLEVGKVKNVFFGELSDKSCSQDENRPQKELCVRPSNESKEWKSYDILFEGIEFEELPEPEIYFREGPFLICMWHETRIYCSLAPWKTVYIENRVGGDSQMVTSSYVYNNEYHEGLQKLLSLILS